MIVPRSVAFRWPQIAAHDGARHQHPETFWMRQSAWSAAANLKTESKMQVFDQPGRRDRGWVGAGQEVGGAPRRTLCKGDPI
jgi:hypothetical protein